VYSSPIELSYDKFVGMKESNRRKDIRLTSLESTVAVLEKNLKLERRLKSGRYKRNSRSSRRSNRSATLSVRRRRNPTGSRIPRDTHVNISDAKQNGSGQAATDGGTQ